MAFMLAGCPMGDNNSGGDDNSGGDTTAPAEVSGLAGAAGDGSVTVTWTDPPDADLDHIEITWTGGAAVLKVAAGEQTRTVTGLGNGTAYTFTLTAVDASGNKSAGQTITLTPVAPNPFTDANVAVRLVDIDAASAALTWTDPPDAGLDHIEVTWTPGGDTPQTVPKGTQTAAISGLTSDVSYTFTLRAVDTEGNKSGGVTVTLIPNKLQKWTRVISAEDGNPFGATRITALAYGGGRFVAGGWSGKMAWSADGITWTAVTGSTFGSTTIQSITWGRPSGQEKFVAVGDSGKMAWSADGVTWTAVTDSIFGSTTISGITWGGTSGQEKFIAVGSSGKMAWSADGQSWTAVTGTDSAFGSTSILSIAWGGSSGQEKFVAGGNSAKMAWSANGLTWTAVTDSTFNDSRSIIAYITFGGPAGQKRFFASDFRLKQASSSVNGTQWAVEDLPPPHPGPLGPITPAIKGIAWGGGKMVVHDGDSVFWGPDTASLSGLTPGGSTYTIPGLGSSFTSEPFQAVATDKRTITGIAWGGPAGQQRFVVTCYGGFAYSEIFSQ
jgi:hypothetical protein